MKRNLVMIGAGVFSIAGGACRPSAMLHDYIDPSETFVTCPNQDVAYLSLVANRLLM